MKKMQEINLGFLASGTGSNVKAIVDSCRGGILRANPAIIISNNKNAGVMEYSRQEHIPCFHVSKKTHPDPDSEIADLLSRHNVTLVILAGYMKKVGPKLLKAFKNKIINIHPSLLPKYGGKGMYGMKVHEAVIAASEKTTGVTIHLVDDKYDQGKILLQQEVKVESSDTPESLAGKVLEVEHKLYTIAINRIISGDLVLPAG